MLIYVWRKLISRAGDGCPSPQGPSTVVTGFDGTVLFERVQLVAQPLYGFRLLGRLRAEWDAKVMVEDVEVQYGMNRQFTLREASS